MWQAHDACGQPMYMLAQAADKCVTNAPGTVAMSTLVSHTYTHTRWIYWLTLLLHLPKCLNS